MKRRPSFSAGVFYLDILLHSRGWKASNRLHARSFLVNILSQNADELIKKIDLIFNPKSMYPLFRESAKIEFDQNHREINRFIHNYVCSVSTFADNSRNFMKKNYSGTPFHNEYVSYIDINFNRTEIGRFVRELRNYIVHKGIPNSKLRMKIEQDKEDSAGNRYASIETGAYYQSAELREWDKWSHLSRQFIARYETIIPINEIYIPHFNLTRRFNIWFEDRFRYHHAADYLELNELKKAYRRLEMLEARKKKRKAERREVE